MPISLTSNKKTAGCAGSRSFYFLKWHLWSQMEFVRFALAPLGSEAHLYHFLILTGHQ